MRRISVLITDRHYEMLEALITAGEYISLSEAVRDAIRQLLANKAKVLEVQRQGREFA